MLKQKTVYFREEDLPLWEAVPNKAEFLHQALASTLHLTDQDAPFVVQTLNVGRTTDNPQNIKENFDGTVSIADPSKPARVVVPVAPNRFKRGVCKIHGLPLDGRGRCLQKGCKYS